MSSLPDPNGYLGVSPASGRMKVFDFVGQSAGEADAGKPVALGADGRLDNSLMPTGIGADSRMVTASENLSAGDLVNVWLDDDVYKVRKADASDKTKEAHGFVVDSAATSTQAAVYFEGTNNQSVTGSGRELYLSSATPGKAVAQPEAGAKILQRVGFRVSDNSYSFEAGLVIELE